MTLRPDISNYLIHFTKGDDDTDESAYRKLKTIVSESRLLGSDKFIKGSYKCVCFTEAPLTACINGFLSHYDVKYYSLFGIMFEKSWIFEQGGRPVIYQTDEEYSLLNESIRWRHKRYEPHNNIDFTWEREWRIRTETLGFSSTAATIILPNMEWAERLRLDHDFDQDIKVQQYSLIMDETIAEQYREGFQWTTCPLSTL